MHPYRNSRSVPAFDVTSTSVIEDDAAASNGHAQELAGKLVQIHSVNSDQALNGKSHTFATKLRSK